MITKETLEEIIGEMEHRDVGIASEVTETDDDFTIDFFTSRGERFQISLGKDIDKEIAYDSIASVWSILRESELEDVPLRELLVFEE